MTARDPPGAGSPPREPPPLDEDPGKGQFYFPGRPRGCATLLLAALALAAGALVAA